MGVNEESKLEPKVAEGPVEELVESNGRGAARFVWEAKQQEEIFDAGVDFRLDARAEIHDKVAVHKRGVR